MYTFLKIVGYVFIVLLCLLGVIGFFASPESEVSVNEIIESPATVVWRTLIDVDRIPEWDRGVARIRIANTRRLRKDAQIDYYSGGAVEEIIYKEIVTDFVPDRHLVFRDVRHNKIPLQQNYIRDYRLKPLLDGSTELTLQVRYRCGSFITRILDRIYLRGYTMNKHRNHLSGLKHYIENL